MPIFTIADTQKYLKNLGYFYNPETFQTTNAKYEGDCFTAAALSNNKDRIVFSTGCLPGDLPQAWIGVKDELDSRKPIRCPKLALCSVLPQSAFIKFLIAGSGRNFVWSEDDKTITYEADLGLSGMTETRTIDSATGEILKRKNSPVANNIEVKDWKNYRNEKYGFEVKYPLDFKEQKTESDTDLLIITKTDGGNSYNFGISVRKNYKVNQIVYTIRNAKEINIGNHLGYEYFYIEGASMSEVALIQAEQDALSINFDLIGNGQNFATADDRKVYVQDFFSQILSTFKFIEPEK